ncbi:hypothetical protein mRhiFer1_010040 [Rhinolophus ferrumequinum]|uniref:Uncharacterized protein n=1 Tax=Rhinolophus ferrumequinum TaxID=59479 RepID=A0A7J7Y5C3_RHIFE|nr:hypothetical protein mRhiFer1_010040 [Rhinolophus ferrumequinum]
MTTGERVSSKLRQEKHLFSHHLIPTVLDMSLHGQEKRHPLPLRTLRIMNYRAWSLAAHTGPPSLRLSCDQPHPLQCSTKPMSTNPMSTTSWGSHGCSWRWDKSQTLLLEPLPFQAGLREGEQVLEGEIPKSISPAHNDWQLPPTPVHVPVLTYPQGCKA